MVGTDTITSVEKDVMVEANGQFIIPSSSTILIVVVLVPGTTLGSDVVSDTVKV